MAANLQPLANGKSYEYADIQMIVLGVPIREITAIEYGEEDEIQDNYSTGRYVSSRGYGRITATCKVTMLFQEVQNILSVAPGGRLAGIPEFDIIVTLTDINLITVVHKIRNCRFKKQNVSSATGDTSIPMELDIACSNIEWV